MNKDDILKATKRVTNKWAKVRKAEERQSSRRFSRSYYMYSDRIYIKEVAYKVMKQAYMKASDNGTLPANARQIMYAARPLILAEATSKKFDSKYFTQHLLPDYLEEHPSETSTWDVVFDARGRLFEPHTKTEVGLGTIGVRNYLHEIRNHKVLDIVSPTVDEGDSFPTKGPKNRYGAILFIEKEGFNELFKRAELANKYDLCIMSTKGMPTTAARQLVDELCGDNVPLFVLHDFDKAGFSIVGTLQRNTRRYSFRNYVNVIDMGLRLADVKKYNLESEECSYGKSNPVLNLTENGATREEIEFLCSKRSYYGSSGRRVELNALSSRDLLNLIESKLKKYGVRKIVPDNETLKSAYRRAALVKRLNEQLEEIMKDTEKEVDDIEIIPKQIQRRVRKILKECPTKSWDSAITNIIEEDTEGDL